VTPLGQPERPSEVHAGTNVSALTCRGRRGWPECIERLVKGRGDAAQSPRTARGVVIPFEPSEGGDAYLGQIGEFIL
jgi:hypothetical protein